MKNLRKDPSGVSGLRDKLILNIGNKVRLTYLADSLGLYTSVRKQVTSFQKRPSPYPDIENISIAPSGVRNLYDRLNAHKASDTDDLSERVLKECSAEIAQVLACIFNQSLTQAIIPNYWQQANVVPMYKKGERYDPASYRPVSLTCICCKSLEHILVSKIMQHKFDQNIIYKLSLNMTSVVVGLPRLNLSSSSMICTKT